MSKTRTAQTAMSGMLRALLFLGWLCLSAGVWALDSVPLHRLPPEARETLQLIRQGGPFPFSRDGVVFGNREKILPVRPHGYYREYTVRTPGLSHRGARRIVCGGGTAGPVLTSECYYTADHYRSFQRIEE